MDQTFPRGKKTVPLFSTYRQRENRVTATLLAVLERLRPSKRERILRKQVGHSKFKTDTFENQVIRKHSVPDAKIGSGPAICIETKTERGSVCPDQIARHINGLKCDETLLVLTPDDSRPSCLCRPEFAEVSWANFLALDEGVREALEDEDEACTETESFLLKEFSRMLRRDGLLASAKDRVMVIAAGKWAWDMYGPLSVYRCAVKKLMQTPLEDFDRLAFYSGGRIQRPVPKIISVIDKVDVTQDAQRSSLDSCQQVLACELWERVKQREEKEKFNGEYKIMFLTTHADADTECLPRPIENDKTSQTGKRVAFTFGSPVYVTLDSLKKASKTSELVRC